MEKVIKRKNKDPRDKVDSVTKIKENEYEAPVI